MGELGELRRLGCRIFSGNLTQVGQDVALQEATLGARGRDLGHFRLGDVLLAQELDDGGVERVGGVLGLGSGGRLQACKYIGVSLLFKTTARSLEFEELVPLCGFCCELEPRCSPADNSRLEMLNTLGCRRANIAGTWLTAIRAAILYGVCSFLFKRFVRMLAGDVQAMSQLSEGAGLSAETDTIDQEPTTASYRANSGVYCLEKVNVLENERRCRWC